MDINFCVNFPSHLIIVLLHFLHSHNFIVLVGSLFYYLLFLIYCKPSWVGFEKPVERKSVRINNFFRQNGSASVLFCHQFLCTA